MQTVEIKLNTAIEVDGIKYEVLNMREPKVRDSEVFDSLKGTELQKEIIALANLCDVSPDVIRELTFKDFAQMQGVYQSFLS